YLCCPEGVIYKKDKLVDIDYAFCKGCGICARVCPKKAIKMIREGEDHEK
ncbi:MAG TPA: 4Fe-4S binding protein, partial [Clostridium sp.]|nr:4Fe-4S binding protein [Clostridium sp.]